MSMDLEMRIEGRVPILGLGKSILRGAWLVNERSTLSIVVSHIWKSQDNSQEFRLPPKDSTHLESNNQILICTMDRQPMPGPLHNLTSREHNLGGRYALGDSVEILDLSSSAHSGPQVKTCSKSRVKVPSRTTGLPVTKCRG